MLLIKNGRVLDPGSGIDAQLDIWIEGARIARVVPAGTPGAASSTNGDVIDATGLVVAPGFIDLHCHLRLADRRFVPRQLWRPARRGICVHRRGCCRTYSRTVSRETSRVDR